MTTLINSAEQQASSQNLLRWLIVVGVAVVVSLMLVLVLTTERGLFDTTPKQFGGDFTLQGINGDVALSDFRGKVVLLYFGFLNCPEVCPASMAVYQQTLSVFNADELKHIQPILVTIDPKRDTAQKLSEYGEYFHKSIIGLTGTEESIRQVANQYGAYFKTVPTDSDVEYVFEHTSRYYVINQEGQLIDAMRHSTTANELSARIRTLL